MMLPISGVGLAIMSCAMAALTLSDRFGNQLVSVWTAIFNRCAMPGRPSYFFWELYNDRYLLHCGPRDSGYQPIAVTCLEGARDARGD